MRHSAALVAIHTQLRDAAQFDHGNTRYGNVDSSASFSHPQTRRPSTCACYTENGSYKRVKGRGSHAVEERISMHSHKPHATRQPSLFSHMHSLAAQLAQPRILQRPICMSHHVISTGTATPARRRQNKPSNTQEAKQQSTQQRTTARSSANQPNPNSITKNPRQGHNSPTHR